MKLGKSLAYQPVELAFGTSGLRGLVSDMTDLECYINTAGFLKFCEQRDGLHPGDRIYLAGDLRPSTPRIMRAVATAIQDAGYRPVNCGRIPIPALALYALSHGAPGIMVTGSHIPANRNGIKFYKREGEVLKVDEAPIHTAVAEVRERLYRQDAQASAFDENGALRLPGNLGKIDQAAKATYVRRYLDVFAPDSLKGKHIAVYQQSAVVRDILVEVLAALGATVIPFDRSDEFIPIDTDNITPEDARRFREFSKRYPDAFAIVSADGDSDRPIVIDETGTFHRGDMLGCVTARFLEARFAAVPIICNDALDAFCQQESIALAKTKVGSPLVIDAMLSAPPDRQPAVAWEMNGGFLTATDLSLGHGRLQALPTRDAMLPMLCALQVAVRQQVPLSAVFAALPRRFASQGLIDEVSEVAIKQFRALTNDEAVMRRLAEAIADENLGAFVEIDLTDGLRLLFDSGDVLHLRPSANAPQFRVYSNAASQDRADQLATVAVAPDGYIVRLLGALDALGLGAV